MKNNRLSIILIFSALLLSLVIIFSNRKNINNLNLLIPSSLVSTSTPPTIPPAYKGKLSFRLNFAESDYSFSEELPLLNIRVGQIDEKEAFKIASSAGFLQDPQVAEDSLDGKTYIWTGKTSSLVIYSEIGKLDFSLETTIPNTKAKTVADNLLIQTATNFLTKKLLIDAANLKTREVTNRNYYYQINFSPLPSDFNIISLYPENGLIDANITDNAQILSVHASKIDLLSTSSKIIKIKNFEEFTKSIEKAILIKASTQLREFTLGDLYPNSIKTISLNSVRISYLFVSPKDSLLYPFFVLSGKAEIVGYAKNADLILYLPAFK